MSKIILKSQEQNVNYLKTGEVKSGYVLRPVQYSRIESADIVDYCANTCSLPRTFLAASLAAIESALTHFILNGHSVSIPNLGTFSLSCEGKVAEKSEDAGMNQFKGFHLNFRPSVQLKSAIDRVEAEMDGVYRCLDLEADNKIYQKVIKSDDGSEGDNGANNNGGGTSGDDDLVG